MSVSRFLRRAAVAAALAGAAAVALSEAEKRGIYVRFSSSLPLADGDGRGHLGLVRAHPGLRELNAALDSSRGALFLDAAHVLAAGALRESTFTGAQIRYWYGPQGFCKLIAAAESTGDTDAAVRHRLNLALVDAREGRLDEALAAVVRLARDSPGDSRPRFAAAALCVLHGRSGTAFEWIKSVPHKASSPESAQFFETILLAMPGSSPHKLEEDINWMWLVTNIAYVPADEWLSRKMEEAGRSSLEKLEIAVLRVLLRRLVKPKKKRRATATRLSPSNLNKVLVECSQLILAPLLRARPLAGERVREVRSVAERALVDADVEAAVDVNLLLAFVEARDGRFWEAMRRYKVAAKRDPSDCRPYELAVMLCSLTGRTVTRDSWLRAKERAAPACTARARAELPALFDELAVAAALGDGNLTARDPQRGRVLPPAWRQVDAALAAALRRRDLTWAERAQLRGLHGILRAKVRPLLLDAASHEPPDTSSPH
ncbi:uncharacterized protein LOC121055912 [Oryza brachyantha]|uniref:uncharacterized protein LOC121055912 n=1 Tax=Oryza brachyantha TaxID=4533 RepID=UPI001AD9EF27|nr:uncharacterized protein LOC121055912 [Oryza brachyantha]